MTLEDRVVLHRLIHLPAVLDLLLRLTVRRHVPVRRVLRDPVQKVRRDPAVHQVPVAVPGLIAEEDNMISKIQKLRI